MLALPGVEAPDVEAVLAARAAASGQNVTLKFLRGLAEFSQFVVVSYQEVFTVRAEAVTETGAVFVREAVAGLTGDSDRPFEVYAWRQGKRAAAGNGQAD